MSIRGNNIHETQSLEGIKSLKSLKRIFLANIPFNKISEIAQLKELETLLLMGCKVEYFAPEIVTELPKLKKVFVRRPDFGNIPSSTFDNFKRKYRNGEEGLAAIKVFFS